MEKLIAGQEEFVRLTLVKMHKFIPFKSGDSQCWKSGDMGKMGVWRVLWVSVPEKALFTLSACFAYKNIVVVVAHMFDEMQMF